jgi:hypothetical protein
MLKMSEKFIFQGSKPKGEIEKSPPGMRGETIANQPEDALNKEGKTIDPNTSDEGNIEPSRIREADTDQLGDFTPEFLAQELRDVGERPEEVSEVEPGEGNNY